MGLLSFKGGIHPPHAKKTTEHKPVVQGVEPKIVTIPMHQHIGAPCDPIVEVGDYVKVGQKIGETTSFVSAPIHSSVSGTVKKIQIHGTLGGKSKCIIIESDGLNTLSETVVKQGDLDSLDGKEILNIIKEAGIVGMGGAGFPTHVKLSPPPDKKIEFIILNGAECEPYLTADHRLMLESPEKIVHGLKAMMKVVDVQKGLIGIESNKPDAIEVMKKAVEKEAGIEVVPLKTKYPQGAEKQLIYACTKREVPSGGLPLEVGVVVANVASAAAISDAIEIGMPLIERICTVTGDAIETPMNLRIKTGTMIREIIEQCGGLKDNHEKIIWGGPMMGISMSTIDIPATKTASGVLCFSKEAAYIPESSACIKCGKCVDICPAFIQPFILDAYSLKHDYEKTQALHVLDCIECGSCSFVCPAKRPLLHSIRVAKKEVLARKKRV